MTTIRLGNASGSDRTKADLSAWRGALASVDLSPELAAKSTLSTADLRGSLLSRSSVFEAAAADGHPGLSLNELKTASQQVSEFRRTVHALVHRQSQTQPLPTVDDAVNFAPSISEALHGVRALTARLEAALTGKGPLAALGDDASRAGYLLSVLCRERNQAALSGTPLNDELRGLALRLRSVLRDTDGVRAAVAQLRPGADGLSSDQRHLALHAQPALDEVARLATSLLEG